MLQYDPQPLARGDEIQKGGVGLGVTGIRQNKVVYTEQPTEKDSPSQGNKPRGLFIFLQGNAPSSRPHLSCYAREEKVLLTTVPINNKNIC